MATIFSKNVRQYFFKLKSAFRIFGFFHLARPNFGVVLLQKGIIIIEILVEKCIFFQGIVGKSIFPYSSIHKR
jgi:hypothetical protein